MAHTMPGALVSAKAHKLFMESRTTAGLFPSLRFLRLRAQLRDSGKEKESKGGRSACASQACQSSQPLLPIWQLESFLAAERTPQRCLPPPLRHWASLFPLCPLLSLTICIQQLLMGVCLISWWGTVSTPVGFFFSRRTNMDFVRLLANAHESGAEPKTK